MLGRMHGAAPHTDQLLGHYLRFSKLDGKPEKGERKIADDFLLILDEVLAEAAATENRQDASTSQLDLFRVGLLEHALSLSPYNFDIQMALVKLYDSQGQCIQFKSALDGLGIKGVQQESMGFLQLRNSIEWGSLDSLFRPAYLKYQQYTDFNERDLKELKHKSFKADNWDQVENFIEYERFLKSSYFSKVSVLVSRFHDQVKASSSNAEAARECFEATAEQLSQQVASFGTTTLTRTQDIKLLLPKFSVPTKGEMAGTASSTFLDRLNCLIIENDPVYSRQKFERKSNFKPHVVNSLGIFENEAIFKKLTGQLSLVASMYAGGPLALNVEEEKKEEESKEGSSYEQALFSEQDLSQFDFGGSDQNVIATQLLKVNLVLKGIMEVYQAMTTVSKQDGQPAVETAQQIITKVSPVLKSLLELISQSNSERQSGGAANIHVAS